MSTLSSPSNSTVQPAVEPLHAVAADRQWTGGRGMVPAVIILAAGLALAVATAYLVTAGRWEILVGLYLMIPAVVALVKYPLLALMIWFALAPFLVITPDTALRSIYWMIHRGLPPVALIMILFRYAVQIDKRPVPRLGWIELAMAGYVGISFISIVTLNADPQATAILFFDRVVIPMCLYLIVRLSAPDEQDLQRLVPLLFFICLTQSILGILSWSAPQLLPGDWLGLAGARTTGSLRSPGVYTTTLMFSGVLILHAAMQRKPGLIRTLYLATFALAVFCVFLSFSRGSWLGGLVVIAGLFFIYPKFMIRLGLIAIPIMILLSSLFGGQMQYANERLNASESALSRLPVFQAALRMFEEKPVSGWGYGNFDRYDRQFQGRVGNLVIAEKDHASHNVYLTLIAEQGALGLLLFLAPVVGWLILSWKAWTKMPARGLWSRKLLLALWLIIADYVVVNSFSNMRVVVGLGLWWVTLGLIGHLVYTFLPSNNNTLPAWVRQALARSKP